MVMTPQNRRTRLRLTRPTAKASLHLLPANGKIPPVDWAAFLAGISHGKTVLEYGADRTIFVQGDPADSVWYLQKGKVKLAVTSQQGKEAIVTVLGDNEFFGEGCLAGQPLRISTAIAVTRLHSLPDRESADGASAPRAARNLRNCSSRTCFHATFDLKRIWSTSFSTPARSAWPGFSYCWRILARKAEPKRSIPESIRNTWRKWSAPPGRGSVIS